MTPELAADPAVPRFQPAVDHSAHTDSVVCINIKKVAQVPAQPEFQLCGGAQTSDVFDNRGISDPELRLYGAAVRI